MDSCPSYARTSLPSREMRSVQRRAGFAALVAAAIAAVTLASQAPAERGGASGLPRADIDVPRGLDPALESVAEGKLVRVRILLREQPVVAAAQRLAFQRHIETRQAGRVRRLARRTPLRVSPAERQIAAAAEQSYEDAVASLADEAASAMGDQDDLAKAIRRGGGVVLGREPVPSSIVARVPGGLLDRLAERGDVQAIAPAPKPQPQLDVAKSVVGAPTWWAAGYLGGEGGSDTVPGDVGLEGEGPDATHPAFAGLTIDNSPGVNPTDDDDHGTHVAGVVASGDATYTGVAPGIDKLLGASSDAYLLGVAGSEGPGAADPAETINVSFGGTPATDNDYDYADVLTSLFGVGWAFAAGNDGPTGGTASGIGRDGLSVGAFDDLNTVS